MIKEEMKERIRAQLKLAQKGVLFNASRLYGDISQIFGDAKDIWGDVSKIRGDVSKISGDVSGISGDVFEILEILKS